MITNGVLIINEAVRVCGLTIWGSPVTCDDAAHCPQRRKGGPPSIRRFRPMPTFSLPTVHRSAYVTTRAARMNGEVADSCGKP